MEEDWRQLKFALQDVKRLKPVVIIQLEELIENILCFGSCRSSSTLRPREVQELAVYRGRKVQYPLVVVAMNRLALGFVIEVFAGHVDDRVA